MFAACSKDTTEDIAVLPDGILRVSFSDDDSRVQLDENSRTVWNEGDLISVFNKTTGNECWQFDGKTGDSVGTISRVSGSAGGSAIGKIFAVYPYAEYNAISADGTITTEIPATQKYCADSYGVGNNIMVANSENGDLAFKNVLGWIKIRLSGTETVKSLVLEGNDGETLAGAATIDADLAVSLAADASKSLTLDCGEGVALSSDPTAFYFAVVPQVFEKGITVTAHYSDGKTFEKSTDKSITVEQNHIVPMTEIITSIPDNEIWYKTIDNKPITLPNNDVCDASLIENLYINGLGKLIFRNNISLIKKDAFSAQSQLSEIILPSKVKILKGGAFRHCVNLKQAIILGNLSIVEQLVFWDCKQLKNFVSPNASTDGRYIIIDDELKAVAGYNLTNVTIPTTIVRIGETAFKGCTDITTVTIPSNVKYIDNSAFSDCSNLTALSLSEGLISIGSDYSSSLGDTFAFTALTEVTFPQSLKYVDSWSFRGCKNIKGFYGNEKFHSPDNKCLYANFNCGAPLPGIYIGKFVGYDLESYIIQEGVWAIENYAFQDLPLLTEVTFPNTLEIIGYDAFFNCPNLRKINGKMASEDGRGVILNDCYTAFVARADAKKVYIQKGVKSIGKSAFTHHWDFTASGFESGTTLCILEEIVMCDDITDIANEAFAWSKTLKSITMSANTQKIASMDIIANSYNLETIYLRAAIPPQIITPQSLDYFYHPKLTIYVPEESLTLYNSSESWTPYKDYIKGYHYTDLPEPDYYISTDFSADGKVEVLQKATVGRGIDIILMGDAFSDRQIAAGDYDTAMRQAADNLFTEEPYKSFRDMFNVYAVTAVSATEGYEHENTAFSGYFGGGTEVGGNDAKAFEYAQKAIAAERIDDALIVVMMNSQAYAGTCYMYYPSSNSDYGRGVSVAYFPLGTDNDMFAQLLHHEACGHGFAKLADEYAYEYMGAVPTDYVSQVRNWQSDWGWYKNVDFTSDPATVKWHTFLFDPRYANEGLGVFEGGATYWTGVWRPTENSIMRYNTGGFNAPSREAIYYRIHKLAYGESWNYDYEDFVAYDAVNRKASAGISFSTPIVPKDFVPLAPPVIVGKSWRDAR